MEGVKSQRKTVRLESPDGFSLHALLPLYLQTDLILLSKIADQPILNGSP